eukprot:1698680-Pyramimonas_sp.AAC.1
MWRFSSLAKRHPPCAAVPKRFGAGVPWLGAGVPCLGSGVPWLGAGVPWLGFDIARTHGYTIRERPWIQQPVDYTCNRFKHASCIS